MSNRYLGSLTQPLPRRTRILRIGVGAFLTIWWGLAGFSGYRAIYQVRDVAILPAERILQPETVIRAEIVTSGRTVARLRLSLEQDGVEELLASRSVPGNRDGALDQRFRREMVEVVLTRESLARFQPGAARLRAVGLGSSQFLRVPPPKVREIPVIIAAYTP